MDNVFPLTPIAPLPLDGRQRPQCEEGQGTLGPVLWAPKPFGHEELQALRMDGLLREVLPGRFVTSDTAITPAVRALILRSFLPAHLWDRIVAVRSSACWVYGLLEGMSDAYVRSHATPLLNFGVEYSHRPRVRAEPGVMISEIKNVLTDVLDVNGLGVFTPLRTALDLACHGVDSEFSVLMIRRLSQLEVQELSATGFDYEEILARIRILPGSASRSRAMSRIAEAQSL